MQIQTFKTQAEKSQIQFQLDGDAETANKKLKKIILLENAVYYFIDYVLIILEPDAYRLVVIADGCKTIDKCYSSIKGAKIAFFRFFKHRAQQGFTKPRWSVIFPPEQEWLDDRLKGIPFSYQCNLD